jgi:hypothetical protein
MGCRCTDIAACNSELERLRGLLGPFPERRARAGTWYNEQTDASSKADQALEMDARLHDYIYTYISREGNIVVERDNGLHRAVMDAIEALEQKIASLKSEDEAYHAAVAAAAAAAAAGGAGGAVKR